MREAACSLSWLLFLLALALCMAAAAAQATGATTVKPTITQ
ncbi:MAG TPA: hypothetical protein PKU80_01025 [Candidatus Limiplasma sp.]|nr:hypothetical protein [Candidatus Limiplasma sp.]HRX09258.1 hypothetical protein [Candidatus Limiplasma sp.]